MPNIILTWTSEVVMLQKVEIIGLGEKNKIKTVHLLNFSWFKSKLAVRYNLVYTHSVILVI